MTDPKEQTYLRDAADEIGRLGTRDLPVHVDPDLADYMGAFADEALTPEDAIDSLFDDDRENEEGDHNG